MELKGIANAFLRGLYDSFKGMVTVFYLDKEINQRTLSRLSPTRFTPVRRRQSDSKETTPVRSLKKHEESKVMTRIIQCGVLNGGIFLLSILLFEFGLLPGVNWLLCLLFGKDSFMGKFVWSWMKPLLSFIFKSLWVVPLFLLSKIVNSLWFQDIADSVVYRHNKSRQLFMFSRFIADTTFSMFVQSCFLIQALAVEYIPIYMLGTIFCLIHMSLLYSLYAFEYKWYSMGWELHKRLTYIESNWPYFIGFGLPLTIFTQMSSSWIINACIFSILFPFFIISGNEANPIVDICDYPLRLFTPVIVLTNAVISKTIKQ